MAKCIECGEYTKYEDSVCYDCWHLMDEEDDDLNSEQWRKDLNFNYQLIKGKIAEVIIERLFITMDFDVHKYGMEHSVPMFLDSLYDYKDKTAKEITSMPDFVVTNREEKTYYVEVKYRKSGQFSYSKLGEEYKYDSGILILVTKQNICSIAIEELKRVGTVRDCDLYKLENQKEFGFDDLDRAIIGQFKKMAIRAFKEL
ncbi:hypothetical protein F8C76_10235 [Flagellimonas olearia]|uniref:Uncharacterized protein n=1 Tax=Flagellimonas olearia TaxID=552546 RepID=A0A6I1DTY7_9FLAO|nr:hypothetical protein [Allomuricauda olearia]KAB7528240.1 hypothetical protein F8C76_10235 [Allomuricauda olearia]